MLIPKTKIPKKEHRDDSGFTLAEVVIASGIIATLIAAFTIFLLNVTVIQQSASLDRTATRIMASEIEKYGGANWDDLMSPPPSGSGTGCVITASRKSLQVIQTGPVTLTVDGVRVSVTRSVVWVNGIARITNAVGNGSSVTYTADNTFIAGQVISIYELQPVVYNLVNTTVTSATSTQFTVSNSATGTFARAGQAGISVYCTGTKDASDLKVLIVSVTWLDGNMTRSKSASIYRSKWTSGLKIG